MRTHTNTRINIIYSVLYVLVRVSTYMTYVQALTPDMSPTIDRTTAGKPRHVNCTRIRLHTRIYRWISGSRHPYRHRFIYYLHIHALSFFMVVVFSCICGVYTCRYIYRKTLCLYHKRIVTLRGKLSASIHTIRHKVQSKVPLQPSLFPRVILARVCGSSNRL